MTTWTGMQKGVLFCAVMVLWAMTAFCCAAGSGSVDDYNVVWDSAGKSSSDSMPLGNGDIALNVWVEQAGDLLFYISKTDAWSGTGQLLKLGKVRIKIAPNPFKEGLPFKQTLQLSKGQIQIKAGSADSEATLSIWVDANNPVIHVEVYSAAKSDVSAGLELWRDDDKVLGDRKGRIVWYHRNETSNFASRLEAHNLAGLEETYPDPLIDRTFGGAIFADGMKIEADKPSVLRSTSPQKNFDIQFHILTAQTRTARQWQDRLDRQMAQSRSIDLTSAGTAHQNWWSRFWNRSYIRITSDSNDAFAPAITPTTVPLRIGADQGGQNRFTGHIARATIYDNALSPDKIKQLADSADRSPARESMVVDWRLDELSDGVFRNLAGPGFGGLSAKVVGDIRLSEFEGIKAVKFDGSGWLERAHAPKLNRKEAVTLAAWVAPEKLAGGGARIIDKTVVGTADGFLLDTYPGNSLRMIVADGTLVKKDCLPVGKWSHVAATFDAEKSEQILYVNGEEVARAKTGSTRRGDEGSIVSQGYALQRFISACAGRGAYPIKFNGTLFTVDYEGDPDYRRWGPDYWLQNTRLVYWPMIASGDFEMILPLFKMYMGTMPLQKERTKRYFGHAGAYYPETMSFWGVSRDGDYGTSPDIRKGKPISFHVNQYIKREWQGAIEVLAIMLDYYAYTEDDGFLTGTLLPYTDEILAFFDLHYKRDDNGKIVIHPAQALETWWDSTNPMPEVAGLKFTLDKLTGLPKNLTTEKRRAFWKRLLGELPPIPIREIDGAKALSPAELFANHRNSENPELYAIFPYRLYGLGKDDIDIALLALDKRLHRGPVGWRQDETQMAYLGRAQEARNYLAKRAATKHGPSRFPAFWGPNFDWIPDQDHGGNLLMALQTMLMQCEDSKIILLGAWPKEWDVDFKLHAPHNTTVSGTVRNAALKSLTVQPPQRRKDVVILQPR